jgi:hypothetical protein
MVYIPPQGVNPNTLHDLLYVEGHSADSHSITNLLRIFSGFKDGVGDYSLGAFVNTNEPISTDVLNKLKQTSIKPYVRTGGALVSGTAASFYSGSHFSNFNQGLTPAQIAAFEFGNYGNQIQVYPTDEANSRA